MENPVCPRYSPTCREAVNAQCFQAEVILNGPKETSDLPRQEAYSFDVVS